MADRARTRDDAALRVPENVSEGDRVLVACNISHKNENFCDRWRGPRRAAKVLSEFIFQVDDLRTGM